MNNATELAVAEVVKKSLAAKAANELAEHARKVYWGLRDAAAAAEQAERVARDNLVHFAGPCVSGDMCNLMPVPGRQADLIARGGVRST